MIESRRMRWAGLVERKRRGIHVHFGGKAKEDLDVGGRITLKCILQR
jgi:hypothetical protein